MNKSNVDIISYDTKLRTHGSCRQLLQDEMFVLLKELPQPWAKMSYASQRLWIDRLDKLTSEVMVKIINQLVTDNRNAIRCTMDGVQIKDALRVTLTAPSTPQNISDLGNPKGSWFFLLTFDEKHHMNRELPEAEDDQRELILDPLPKEEKVKAAKVLAEKSKTKGISRTKLNALEKKVGKEIKAKVKKPKTKAVAGSGGISEGGVDQDNPTTPIYSPTKESGVK